ncbi:Sensor histidine kinase [Rickettsiales bacterium Ac37b]|nr:Sensor histidine kinase [Rickettsiales bacterium Ac37b]
MQTFGIIMILNHLLYFFIFDYHSTEIINKITLRSIACILCLPLLFNNFYTLPLNFHKKLYWYTVLLYCLPFFFTFMTLLNHASAVWLMNCVSAAFFLVLLVNIKVALLILLLGSSLGLFLFTYVFSYKLVINTGQITLYDIVATYFAVIIIGGLFAYKKESYQNMKDYISQNIRLHNELLEHKVQERTMELEQAHAEVKLANESLEQKVEERTVELQQALAAKTEFLNNMSHEIRTPMQGFTVISTSLVEHWKEFNDERKYELASKIASNAKRLSSLLSHLLDLSKFQAGKMRLSLEKVDLNLIILEMIDEAQTLYINGKQLQINFTPLKEAFILADKERIGQVLRNLFVNSIKFSPNNSTLTVSLKLSEITYDDQNKNEAYHFTIKDEGVGIPENELYTIFEVFVQSSKTKTKAGGTGLGLAICKEIIEAHHGEIWAENNEDKGATFNFVVPISQAKQMDGHHIIAENNVEIPIKPATQTTKTANILIIDDEDACLMSMELLLFGSGYNLHKAAGGAAGLEYLKEHSKEIDLMMPDIYGLNVLAEIKQNPELAKIPIILQTGSSDSAEIERAFTLGIVTYIKKPYQRQNIMYEIAEILDRRT